MTIDRTTETSPRTRAAVGDLADVTAAAVRATGLDDFGGTEHEEGLRVLLDDLASPAAGLTGVGRYQLRAQVRSALVARLLSQAGFARFPQYVETPVERPVFVVGLPRTGTTALHRLLTADPRHQGLELWLTEFPQPRPPRDTWDDDPVFGGIQAAYAAHHVLEPEFMGLHYIDAASVEECWRLLRQSGTSVGFESMAYVPGYSAWLARQDWTAAYARHRANLQLIGLGDERRWVLKNPSHLLALDALMAAYPDALVVVTHRDPQIAVASACSLAARATDGWSTVFTGEVVGRTQLDWVARCHHEFTSSRTHYDAARFVDVQYDDFVADPVATVRRVYEAFDLGWSDAVADAVSRVDRASRSGAARPSHRYRLDDYGIGADDVHRAFAEPPTSRSAT
ncbi:sulfotransferase family protein [Spongisporangium articulatum]|uniref:Sulfotransferase family protein n=1 Tax=Spongisporangium articulatum TaxID=3362603 RepID=A0ABW8AW00_9ACTN